jgi:hypothetical protein
VAKVITDEEYREQLERLRILPKFPELPASQQDMVRTLRRITEGDFRFLNRLISWFVDNGSICPKPVDLTKRAMLMREFSDKPLGNPGCPDCGGTGWITGEKMAYPGGVEPYMASWAKRCRCAPPVKWSKGE